MIYIDSPACISNEYTDTYTGSFQITDTAEISAKSTRNDANASIAGQVSDYSATDQADALTIETCLLT